MRRKVAKEIKSFDTADYEKLGKGLLTGGRSVEKGLAANDVDQKELEMGIAVEKEHSDDIITRTKIALDHLAELPDYYTRLKKMEEDGKKELGIDEKRESALRFETELKEKLGQ